ncbi:CocE/NonD family hydrolase, partial [Aeromicrobium sp. Leaf272]|uniref:CocE/NonD family hydrolase n=1 Tax=Aeromicrobium sp. Leaf272 TaxID=1736317 RepID=UPI001F413D4C
MRRAVLTALSAVLVLAGLAAVPTATAAAAPYTVTSLWFRVTVGEKNDQKCTIVADQYLPRTATARKPVPAILTTNGFGGSKDDQAGLGRLFASRGYAVISYSGLGFGGSGCPISLDDPAVDGKAASQIIGYLGGATGTAYLDAGLTKKAPALTVVKRDARNQLGTVSRNDPRVGMVGISYGGGIQFA